MSNCPYKADLVLSGSFLSVRLFLWIQDKIVLNIKDNVKHHGIIKEMLSLQTKSITKILIHYLSSLNIYVPHPQFIHWNIAINVLVLWTLTFRKWFKMIALMKGILDPGMTPLVKCMPVVKTWNKIKAQCHCLLHTSISKTPS